MVAAINVSAPAYVVHPAISPDGLAFYFTIRGSTLEHNGIYEAIRRSTAERFPPATRMNLEVNHNNDFVTGVSADRLALFMQSGYAVGLFTRKRISDAFSNPNAPIQFPTVPGFRTRPFGDCSKLIGTCINGCNNEDSCVFSR